MSGGDPDPAQQLDRFAEAGNCSDDRAPVDRPNSDETTNCCLSSAELNVGIHSAPADIIAPAIQHGKEPFWARLQLFSRQTLNAGKHAANQPARLAQLDDGNDRATVVQGDEGCSSRSAGASRHSIG